MTLDTNALLEAHPYIGRFANQPALLQPGSEAWLATCLRGHAGIEYDPAFAGPYGLDRRYGQSSPDYAFSRLGNLAVIPIRGALLHGSMARDRYATGYDFIRLAARQAAEDEEVAGIVYLHNSNGGEVAGNFDLADELNEIEKPSIAIVDEHAYSASYSLASAANRIVVPRTGGVGSIGVLTAHVDMSKLLEKMGLDVNFIYAGKHKVDGNPFRPLGESVKNRMQVRIDALYNEFVAIVARNRALTPQSVRATEALTFSASEAIEAGLADAVYAPGEALAAFIDELKPTGVFTMKTNAAKAAEQPQTNAPSEPQTNGAEGATSQGTYTQADLDTARAEGVAAERARIQGIMNGDEAKTRPIAASRLAFTTGMSVEDASAFLAGLPEEPSQGSAVQGSTNGQSGAFEKAMSNTPNPEISPDDNGASGEQMSEAQRILASYHSVTGRKTS